VKPDPAHRREKGRLGEDLAARFLEEQGLTIVERNVRCSLGEIDMVARDGEVVVIVEVRSRYGRNLGSPLESVTLRKQRRLTLLAQWYRKWRCSRSCSMRFDVVAITWERGEPRFRWIPNAFEARA